MSDMQDPLDRAYYAMLDAAVAMGKAERAYEQALAEETYEYAVQVKCTESKEWRLLSFKLPFITHKTTWFRSQSEAEHQRQEQVSEQVNSRIVRRRVSPPEVISE